jgi:hypothetical protein
VDVHTEQEASEVLATLNQFAISKGEDEESDDDRTSVFWNYYARYYLTHFFMSQSEL